MQELDRFCTKELPLLDGFVPVSKYTSYPKRIELGYYYKSDTEYRQVKGFYQDWFKQHGWRLTDQYDGDWSSKTVEFRNDDQQVIISYGRMGGRANYAIHCEKLSGSNVSQ